MEKRQKTKGRKGRKQSSKNMKRISYLYIILAAICLGTIGIFVKTIGDSVHFMTLNFLRVFIGFLTALIFCPILDKRTFKVSKSDIKLYALLGFIIAISFSLTNIAFLHAPVQNVSLITSMTPFFVLIFAYLILKEEITRIKIVTLILAVLGLIILNPLRAEGFLGNILGLCVAVIDGLMITLMRKADKKIVGIGDVLWFFFFASLFLLPFPFIYGIGNNIPLALILGLGVISTGFAYLFYNLAMEKIEAEIASIIVMITTPLAAISFAVLFINEQLNFQIIAGGSILILAGVYLEMHNKEKEKNI